MEAVKLYTFAECPFCKAAKSFFEEKGVSFEEVLVDENPEDFQALKDKTGMKTVPQIFINDKLIGGFDDLKRLDEDKKLDPMLGLV